MGVRLGSDREGKPRMRAAFGAYQLDTGTFELTRDGELVPVAPQVFEVLAFLASNHERVVSRQELLNAVWGSSFVTDGALATRIKEARRAVGDDGQAQRVIRTAHGRGYRFVAELNQANAGAISPAVSLLGSPSPSGRGAERARLDTLLARASDGERIIAFVTGEAGIGKSTLLEEFGQAAEAQPPLIVGRGQCLEHHGVAEAYMPILEVLSQLARGTEGERVVEALRSVAPTWTAQLRWLSATENVLDREAVTRERMLREFADAVDAVAEHRTVVMLLEDLHWSDPSTLDAIEMLARRASPAGVLVVGTVRTGDIGSRDHGVHQLMREMVGRDLASELPVERLQSEELAQLIEARLGGPPVPELLSMVRRETDGNPLFATKLLDEWFSTGTVVEVEVAKCP